MDTPERLAFADLQNQMDRYSFPAAARIVTVSNDFKSQLVHRGMPEERITVLYNAVQTPGGDIPLDPEALCREKQATWDIAEGKSCGGGRPAFQEKGQTDLVPALHYLRRDQTGYGRARRARRRGPRPPEDT